MRHAVRSGRRAQRARLGSSMGICACRAGGEPARVRTCEPATSARSPGRRRLSYRRAAVLLIAQTGWTLPSLRASRTSPKTRKCRCRWPPQPCARCKAARPGPDGLAVLTARAAAGDALQSHDAYGRASVPVLLRQRTVKALPPRASSGSHRRASCNSHRRAFRRQADAAVTSTRFAPPASEGLRPASASVRQQRPVESADG